MNFLVTYLQKHLEELIEDLVREYTEKLERYQRANSPEVKDIRLTTRANLQLLLDSLQGKKINEEAFDQALTALGEKRAQQGFPLAQVLETFHIARMGLYRQVQHAVAKHPGKISTQSLLEFDLVLNRLFNHIDWGVTNPYLNFKEKVIQSQQAFLKHRLAGLFRLVEAVSSNMSMHEYFEILLNYLSKFYNIKMAGVFLYGARRELIPEHVLGFVPASMRKLRFYSDPKIAASMFESTRALVQTDAPFSWEDIDPALREAGSPGGQGHGEEQPLCYSIYAPLKGRQRCYGLVAMHSLTPKYYSPSEIQQFEILGRIVAVALENAHFYENLIEEKGKAEAIVNSMSNGFLLMNLKEEIVFCNEPAAQFLRIPRQRLIGETSKTIQERLVASAKDPHAVQMNYLRALMNAQERSSFEFVIYRPEICDIRLSMFPVRDHDQRFIGRGLIIEDISREKEIGRMKSEFVSIASHTMRTPMTSILGFTSLLRQRKVTKTVENKYLQHIYLESQRLMSILNDMLELANIEAGKVSLHLLPLDMRQVTQSAIREIRALYDRKIVLASGSSVPRILADAEKIKQALLHLMLNAIKYSSDKVRISIKLVRSVPVRPGWHRSQVRLDLPGIFPAIAVCVEDGGEGIPKNRLNEIFEPFYRLDTESTQAHSGSGLGLTIVKYIVEAHGGKVWGESKRGQGSVFTFLLPLELVRPEDTRAKNRLAS